MKIIYTLYVLAIIVLSLIPGSGVRADLPWDKLGHFIAYAGLGVVSLAAFSTHRGRVAVIMFGICLGVSMEFVQSAIPSRTASFIDEIMNLTGMGLGLFVSVRYPFIPATISRVIVRVRGWFSFVFSTIARVSLRKSCF